MPQILVVAMYPSSFQLGSFPKARNRDKPHIALTQKKPAVWLPSEKFRDLGDVWKIPNPKPEAEKIDGSTLCVWIAGVTNADFEVLQRL